MLVFGQFYDVFAGLVTAGNLGYVRIPDFFQLHPGLVAFLVVVMAVGMFIGAEWLEKKFGKEEEA